MSKLLHSAALLGARLLALALLLLALVFLFYAALFSSSEADQIPQGTAEMIPWFALPAAGAAGAAWSVYEALVVPAGRQRPARYLAAVALCAAGLGAGYAYLVHLTG